MKKIVFLIVFPLIFVACSGDDGFKKNQEQGLPVTVDNLVGTWLAVEEKVDHGTAPRFFESIAEEDRFTYTFFSDLSVKDSNIECIGHYELDNQSSILELNYDCITDEIKWRVSSVTSEEIVLQSGISIEFYSIKFKKQNQ